MEKISILNRDKTNTPLRRESKLSERDGMSST